MLIDKYYHINGQTCFKINGQTCFKNCSSCEVEWLDDQCSLEYERCETCKVNGIYTKWVIDQWRLDNGLLWSIDNKPIILNKNKIRRLHIRDLEKKYKKALKKANVIKKELKQFVLNSYFQMYSKSD